MFNRWKINNKYTKYLNASHPTKANVRKSLVISISLLKPEIEYSSKLIEQSMVRFSMNCFHSFLLLESQNQQTKIVFSPRTLVRKTFPVTFQWVGNVGSKSKYYQNRYSLSYKTLTVAQQMSFYNLEKHFLHLMSGSQAPHQRVTYKFLLRS